jgi:hypothetical protein
MNDRIGTNDERQRELALHRYIQAFEEGDLDVIEAVLSEALQDSELDRQIASVNAEVHAEAGLHSIEKDAEVVRSLLLRHMPSAVLPAEEDPAPTVGDVAARIQVDLAIRQHLHPSDKMANQRLLGSTVPVPTHATAVTIAWLAKELDVPASDRYWEIFRREAVMASMSHEETEVELMAARKQSGRARRSKSQLGNEEQ